MYNTSLNYKKAIKENGRDFELRAVFKQTISGGDVILTGDDSIVSVQIDETVNSGDSITMGSTCSAKAVLELINAPTNINYDNATVVIESGLRLDLPEPYDVEYVPMGTFNVTEVKTDNDYKKLSLTAYDNMIFLDKEYSCKVPLFPANIKTIAEDIAKQAGVDLNPNIAWQDYEISAVPTGRCREVIGMIAGLMGGFARFTRDNKLDIAWYNDTDIIVTKDLQYMKGFEKASQSSVRVTSLTSGTSEEVFLESLGASGLEINFQNDFMTKDISETLFSSRIHVAQPKQAELNNIITNGNFEGVSSWSQDNSTLSAANNILSITGAGTSDAPMVYQTITVNDIPYGHYLYFRLKAKVTNDDCTEIKVVLQQRSGESLIREISLASYKNPMKNKEYFLSGLELIDPSGYDSIRIAAKHLYDNALTADSKVMEISNIIMIDLTEMGLYAYKDGIDSFINNVLVDNEGNKIEYFDTHRVSQRLELVNLIDNGNFNDGVLPWASDANTLISAENNVLSITGTDQDKNPHVYQSISDANQLRHYLYFRFTAKVTNDYCTGFKVVLQELDSEEQLYKQFNIVNVESLVNGEDYIISGIQEIDERDNSNGFDSVRVVITHIYDDEEAAAGKAMEIKNVIMFDLTDMYKVMAEDYIDSVFSRYDAEYFDNIPYAPATTLGVRQLEMNNLINKNTSNWNSDRGTIIRAVNNVLSISGTGATETSLTYQSITKNMPASHNIYFRAKVKVTNSACTGIKVVFQEMNGDVKYGADIVVVNIDSVNENQEYNLSGIQQLDESGYDSIRVVLEHSYTNTLTATNKTMELQNVMLLDLTDLGLSYFTKEEIDSYIDDILISYGTEYFDYIPYNEATETGPLYNLIKNGNFSNTLGWTEDGSAIAEIEDSTLNITGTGVTNSPQSYQIITDNVPMGHYLFFRCKVKSKNQYCNEIKIVLQESGNNVRDFDISKQEAPVEDTEYALSGLHQITLSEHDSIRIFAIHSYYNAETATDKAIEIYDVAMIDLTELFKEKIDDYLNNILLRQGIEYFDNIPESEQSDIYAIQYMPSKLKWRGNPAVQAGDIIKVVDKDNSIYTVCIMDQSIKLGGSCISEITSKASLDNTVNYSPPSKIEAKLAKMHDTMQQAIIDATLAITGQKGGNILINRNDQGFPFEIVIMDSPYIETAQNVWVWNGAGIAFSSSGYGGPYTSAFTPGKIVIDNVTTDTISGDEIEIDLQDSVIKMGQRNDEKIIEHPFYELRESGLFINGNLISLEQTADTVRYLDKDRNKVAEFKSDVVELLNVKTGKTKITPIDADNAMMMVIND